jgi:hypothetical protein
MAGGGKVELVIFVCHLIGPLMFYFRDMVSLLPRLSSFAVSGTPARSQVSDLWHVLKYVNVFLFWSTVKTTRVQIPSR